MTGAAIPAVVLAGGRSRRMGTDKSGLMLAGQTLLQRSLQRLSAQSAVIAVNTNAPAATIPSGMVAIPDPVGGYRGPLAGILAAIMFARALPGRPARVATAAIDSPFFPLDLIQRLAESVPDQTEIAIAACNGRDHPVFGLWPVALAGDLEHWVRTSPDLSVRSFLGHHAFVEVDFEPLTLGSDSLDPFFNVNTPEEFGRAILIEEAFHP